MRKTRNIMFTFIAMVAMITTTLVVTSTSASADTSAPSGTKLSYSHASPKVASRVAGLVSTNVKGKADLRYVMRNGYRTRAKCHRVNSWKQGLQYNCFIVSSKMKGDHYTNSGVGHNGKLYKFDGYVGDQYTPVGAKFYFDKKHNHWRKADCGNYVWFSTHRPKLKVAKVSLTQSFSVTMTLKVAVREAVTATATAWCQTANSSASATAAAVGEGVARIVVKVSAGTAAAARAKGVSSVRINLAQQALAKAKAVAAVKATASATAQAQCTSTPPPPPTPPATKPMVNATTLNDLEQGGYSDNFCVTVNLPNNDAGTVILNAVYGSFKSVISDTAPSINTLSVSGVNRYCVVYYAPNDSTATSTLTETVTVDLVDNVTHASADEYHVPPFQITPKVVHP